MDVTLAGIVMEVSADAPSKAASRIVVKVLVPSNVTVVRDAAFLNAYNPIVVTLYGMLMEVSAAPSNAEIPMVVTSRISPPPMSMLAGITTLDGQGLVAQPVIVTLEVLVQLRSPVVPACAGLNTNPDMDKATVVIRVESLRILKITFN